MPLELTDSDVDLFKALLHWIETEKPAKPFLDDVGFERIRAIPVFRGIADSELCEWANRVSGFLDAYRS